VDKTSELVNNVRQWATDKNIDKRDNVFPQFGKVYEEVNELYTAVIEDDYEEIVDGIGDVAVTLIILSLQLDLNFETCLEAAWDEIKDRKGKTENGVFVKCE
jgi:NTP pyrophosphatase (non-canonical NTP hydrolase)